jgi:hypothetical protein
LYDDVKRTELPFDDLSLNLDDGGFAVIVGFGVREDNDTANDRQICIDDGR